MHRHHLLLALAATTCLLAAGCGATTPRPEATHAATSDERAQGDDAAQVLGAWRFDPDATIELLTAEERTWSEASLRGSDVVMTFRRDGTVTITLTEDGAAEPESESGTFESVHAEGDALTLVLTADDGQVLTIAARMVSDDELQLVALDEPNRPVRVFRRIR